MRRFISALLALTLLAPAPAWALRPRAGRELPATTTSLETGLEERAPAPATGLEGQPYTAHVQRYIVDGVSDAERLIQDGEVLLESGLPPEQNLIRADNRWCWHAHAAYSLRPSDEQPFVNFGLVYDLVDREGTLTLEHPWAEPLAVKGRVIDGRELTDLRGLIPDRVVAWLCERGNRLIHQPERQRALRQAMAHPPSDAMRLGEVVTEGAQGLRVILNQPSQNGWHTQRATLENPLDIPLIIRPLDGTTPSLSYRLREEIAAILRGWRDARGADGPLTAVHIIPDTVVMAQPWLQRLLTLYPQELHGTIAVVAESPAAQQLSYGAGVIVATTPDDVMRTLSIAAKVRNQRSAEWHGGRLVIYDDDTLYNRLVPTVTTPDSWPWHTIVRMRAPWLDPKHLPFFLAQLKDRHDLSMYPAISPEVRYVATRLEAAWLAQPAAGLEEQPYTAAVARLVKKGLSDLDYLRSNCQVGSGDVAYPEHNVFRRGNGWGWHAHVATVAGQRLNMGVFYDLEERAGRLVLDNPWAEPIVVDYQPIGPGEAVQLQGLIPETVVAWLIEQGNRLIAQSDVQQALRHTMAYPPPDVMEMGEVATAGAKGLRVIIDDRTRLRPGDATWVVRPMLGLSKNVWKPSVLIIRQVSRGPDDGAPRGTTTVPLRDEIQVILRSWAYPPAGMAVPYHAVSVLPDVQLKRYPALVRILQLCPPELRGTLAVITKQKTFLDALAKTPGVMTAPNLPQLMGDAAQEAAAHDRLPGTIVLYVPPSEVRRPRHTRSSPWTITTTPLVTPATLPQFLSRLEYGDAAVTTSPQAQDLADRLEQWLATPAAGLEEGQRAKVLRLLRRAFGDSRRLSERFSVEFDGSTMAEHLIDGPGQQRFLHLHAVPSSSDGRDDIGLYFRIRRRGRHVVLTDPWAEPPISQDMSSTFIPLRKLVAPGTIRWLTRAATALVNTTEHQKALRRTVAATMGEANDHMVLGLVATGDAKGLTVLVDADPLRPRDRTWHVDPITHRLVLLLNTQPRMPNPQALRVPPKEEALAFLRLWRDQISGFPQNTQVIPAATLQREPWLLTFLQSYPEELRGAIAVLADHGTSGALNLSAGVITAETPVALMQQLNQLILRRERRTLILYTDEPGDAVRFRALGRPRWRVTTLPTRALARESLPVFVQRVCKSMTPLQHRDDAQLLLVTRRLEQWL